jgi:hypothetical protein
MCGGQDEFVFIFFSLRENNDYSVIKLKARDAKIQTPREETNPGASVIEKETLTIPPYLPRLGGLSMHNSG